MSRACYNDDCDGWDLIRWRGAVASAVRGKRGQLFLLEMLAALDALPQKRLIEMELEAANGEVCALGSVGKRRGLRMAGIDPEDYEDVARAFAIPEALAREIEYINDDYSNETPEHRFERVRAWVVEQLEKGGLSVNSRAPSSDR